MRPQSGWCDGIDCGRRLRFFRTPTGNGIYTFGQPRTGNRAFVVRCNRRFKATSFRVVNNRDVVPHVPPMFIPLHGPMLYRHAGELLHFDATGKLHTDLALWWRTAFRLAWTRRRQARQLAVAPAAFAPLDDQSLNAYIQELRA